MLNIATDIQSLTTFRRSSGEFMKHLKKSMRPMVLTVNGKAAAVVQDAEAYQRLLDIAAQADVREGIRQGLEDARKGRVRPARQFFEEFEEANGFYNEIRAESSNAARRWFRGLMRTILGLEELPHVCPQTEENPQLRHLLYGRKPHVYRVVFRIVEKDKRVDVLHIRHGAMRRFKASELK